MIYTHDNNNKFLSIFLLLLLNANIAVDIDNNTTKNAVIIATLKPVLCRIVRDSTIIIRPEVIG